LGKVTDKKMSVKMKKMRKKEKAANQSFSRLALALESFFEIVITRLLKYNPNTRLQMVGIWSHIQVIYVFFSFVFSIRPCSEAFRNEQQNEPDRDQRRTTRTSKMSAKLQDEDKQNAMDETVDDHEGEQEQKDEAHEDDSDDDDDNDDNDDDDDNDDNDDGDDDDDDDDGDDDDDDDDDDDGEEVEVPTLDAHTSLVATRQKRATAGKRYVRRWVCVAASFLSRVPVLDMFVGVRGCDANVPCECASLSLSLSLHPCLQHGTIAGRRGRR
jgi:hypothetical protein